MQASLESMIYDYEGLWNYQTDYIRRFFTSIMIFDGYQLIFLLLGHESAYWFCLVLSWHSFPLDIAGQIYSSPAKISQHQDYYSTFHKMPRCRFSKREWEDFTSESTKEALSEWAASPEVSKWFAENAHRMRLDPDNNSDDDSMASSSGSSEETAVEDGTGYNFWKWYWSSACALCIQQKKGGPN